MLRLLRVRSSFSQGFRKLLSPTISRSVLPLRYTRATLIARSYSWQSLLQRIYPAPPSPAESTMAQKFVDDTIASAKVVVFSKTYCPFCTMAKNALKDAGLKTFTIVELDERDDGSAIQDVLLAMTGARSVPRVFIGGKSKGGGTDIKKLQDEGKLTPLLKEVGAL